MKRNILIFGAGAIGTYLGASLAQQGHRIIILERRADVPALQKAGLRLVIDGQEIATTAPTFISTLDIIPDLDLDLAVLALKTYHLESLLPDLSRINEYLPPLLSLQNGVESEKLLGDALGTAGIIPGTVTSAVDRLAKGQAVVQANRGLGIAGPHPLARGLQGLFNQAGLQCRYYRRADAMKWSKLLTNLLGNASSAILDLTPGEIYADPRLYRVELAQIKEALRVMGMEGIGAVNLPGVPVSLLAALVRYLPESLSQPLLSRQIGGGRGEKMPSFHIDLHSGKGQSEVDQLNGAVVRAGQARSLPTPVNSFLTSTLQKLIQGDLPPGHYRHDPNRFINDLAAQSGPDLSG